MTIREIVYNAMVGKTIKDVPPYYVEAQYYRDLGEKIPLVSGVITGINIGWNGGDDTVHVYLEGGEHVEQSFTYDFKFEETE